MVGGTVVFWCGLDGFGTHVHARFPDTHFYTGAPESPAGVPQGDWGGYRPSSVWHLISGFLRHHLIGGGCPLSSGTPRNLASCRYAGYDTGLQSGIPSLC